MHLSVPFDVLLAEGKRSQSETRNMEHRHDRSTTASEPDLSDVINILMAARRPLLLTGPAMTASRMPDLLNRVQAATGIPVVAMESPRGLADPSLGNISQIVEQSDCVLLLGKLPDFTLGFGSIDKMPAATIVVVDACSDSLRLSVDVLTASEEAGPDQRRRIIAVNASPGLVAESLCQASVHSADQWREQSTQQLAALAQIPDHSAVIADNADGLSKGSSIRSASLLPQQIGAQVQLALDRCERSVLVCDGGEFGQWAQACVRSDKRVINGPSGAIGGSLPQAIAAKIAQPDSVVVAMLGDGTVGFHLAELETSVREHAPVIVIVGNDSRWNAEYQIQLRDYGADRLHSCELGTDVRYDIAATGLGFAGAMVQTEAELAEALAEAVQRSRRDSLGTCINVVMTGCPAPVFKRDEYVSNSGQH